VLDKASLCENTAQHICFIYRSIFFFSAEVFFWRSAAVIVIASAGSRETTDGAVFSTLFVTF
jgi:hypothetical protein